MKRIYLDHTATTPLDPRVLESMLPFFAEKYGNPSSIHANGREGRSAVETARKTVADAIGALPGEIVFTSGGTESNNAALRGTVEAAQVHSPHLITGAAEHHSVLETCNHLRDEGRCTLAILRVDEDSLVAPEALRQEITPSTCLVSLMLANNEVGSIAPMKELAERCRDRSIPVHTDAVQALGRIPLNVDDLGVDLMTISAHKIYGPKGIGALYVRRGTVFSPILLGGGQERGRRPGTENVPAIVGFARAVELATRELDIEANRLRTMRDQLEQGIRSEFQEAIVNGHPGNRLPHILNVSFDSRKIRLEGEMLLLNLDLAGIALASGSACSSGSLQPSHVILAMGRDPETANATLRFAFGKSNTQDDIGRVIKALREAVEKSRKT